MVGYHRAGTHPFSRGCSFNCPQVVPGHKEIYRPGPCSLKVLKCWWGDTYSRGRLFPRLDVRCLEAGRNRPATPARPKIQSHARVPRCFASIQISETQAVPCTPSTALQLEYRSNQLQLHHCAPDSRSPERSLDDDHSLLCGTGKT